MTKLDGSMNTVNANAKPIVKAVKIPKSLSGRIWEKNKLAKATPVVTVVAAREKNDFLIVHVIRSISHDSLFTASSIGPSNYFAESFQ